MKKLVKIRKDLIAANRWDIDFHLPAEGIKKFPSTLLKRVDEVASVVKDKRDPTKKPDQTFQYIDISAVDVAVGSVTNPQDVDGLDAPSRARKVVQAFDILVSTCRPTRGAVAVVPVNLHNQIASTGFSIVRANDDVNPFYLHFALRLPSTLEQFRKWSTGSSYPAILDTDVKKTMIPFPSLEIQDQIAERVVAALQERSKKIKAANIAWTSVLAEISSSLSGKNEPLMDALEDSILPFTSFSTAYVKETLSSLPAIKTDVSGEDDDEDDGDSDGSSA
jgi:hypothetical protein